LMEILPSTGIFPSFRKAEQKVIRAVFLKKESSVFPNQV
jgi:hypothetical protein